MLMLNNIEVVFVSICVCFGRERKVTTYTPGQPDKKYIHIKQPREGILMTAVIIPL